MNAVDVAKLSETVTVIIQRLPITFCQICQVFGLTYCISKFSVHLHFTFLQHSSDLSRQIRKFVVTSNIRIICFFHSHPSHSFAHAHCSCLFLGAFNKQNKAYWKSDSKCDHFNLKSLVNHFIDLTLLNLRELNMVLVPILPSQCILNNIDTCLLSCSLIFN